MLPDGWGGCDTCVEKPVGITRPAPWWFVSFRCPGVWCDDAGGVPAPGSGMTHAPELRAGDADRQAAADRLRAAHDEGRLDLHEYDRRLAEAYAAVTYGDLDGPP